MVAVEQSLWDGETEEKRGGSEDERLEMIKLNKFDIQVEIYRYYMKRQALFGKQQSISPYPLRDQYSMVSIVKGGQSTHHDHLSSHLLNNTSHLPLQHTSNKSNIHQPKPLSKNKQKEDKTDEEKSKMKRNHEVVSKKKENKKVNNARQDPYKIKKGKREKKEKTRKLKKGSSKQHVNFTLLNTQQTQSIIWYEEYKPEHQLGCSEKLSWNKISESNWLPMEKHKSIRQPFSPQQEISHFQQNIKQFNIQCESQTILEITLKEKRYRPINYLLKKQPHISWVKRAIVINWMMEVLSSFGNKRDTFAIAVNLLDRYLSSAKALPLQKLQLVAGVSILIANKIEDRIFDLNDLVEAMGRNYHLEEILDYELKIVSKLQWKLNPPTAFMWANRLSAHWDAYIKENPPCRNGRGPPQLILMALPEIKFRTEDMNGYNNYRQLMEYIDLTSLDIHTLQYHSRELAASFLYIILNLRLYLYSKEQILSIFPTSSHYVLNSNPFNNYFNNFLQETFNFFLLDLLPTIQYCSTFISIPISLELPPAVQQSRQMSYSQFCSFQTCNEYNLIFLQKRNRDFD